MILPDNIFFLTPNGTFVHSADINMGNFILVEDEKRNLTPASIELVQPTNPYIAPKTTLKPNRLLVRGYRLNFHIPTLPVGHNDNVMVHLVPADINSIAFTNMCFWACVNNRTIVGTGSDTAWVLHENIDGRKYKMDPRNTSTRVEVSTVSGNLVKRIPFVHYSELRRSPELRWGLLQEW